MVAGRQTAAAKHSPGERPNRKGSERKRIEIRGWGRKVAKSRTNLLWKAKTISFQSFPKFLCVLFLPHYASSVADPGGKLAAIRVSLLYYSLRTPVQPAPRCTVIHYTKLYRSRYSWSYPSAIILPVSLPDLISIYLNVKLLICIRCAFLPVNWYASSDIYIYIFKRHLDLVNFVVQGREK